VPTPDDLLGHDRGVSSPTVTERNERLPAGFEICALSAVSVFCPPGFRAKDDVRMNGLRSYAKQFISVLPNPLRLAVFNGVRAIARWTSPHYRRSAHVFRQVAPDHVVRSGPFRGMRYISSASGSALLPKLLGTYELEVHDEVESLCALRPDLVVDIGSAEGYYAIGMAYRLPSAAVICYDTDQFALYLLGRLARANGVAERVRRSGLCTPENLQDVLVSAKLPLVICDVDGAEREILNPARTPALGRAWLLVEMHDFLDPGLSDLIRGRFEKTHDIREHQSRARMPSDLPTGVSLSADDAVAAMGERDVLQTWMVMRPRDVD
jgi:hypothetical protein